MSFLEDAGLRAEQYRIALRDLAAKIRAIQNLDGIVSGSPAAVALQELFTSPETPMNRLPPGTPPQNPVPRPPDNPPMNPLPPGTNVAMSAPMAANPPMNQPQAPQGYAPQQALQGYPQGYPPAAYAPPIPPPPPQAIQGYQQPVQAPAPPPPPQADFGHWGPAEAPVETPAAPPPPPPPPPPPKMSPYFRCGVVDGLAPSGRVYGYHPPSSGHALFAAPKFQVPASQMVPPGCDYLRELLLPVRECPHGVVCSGFAVAAFREALTSAAIKRKIPGYLSPAYLSSRARILDGSFARSPSRSPSSAGSSIADEILTLMQFGVCPDDFMPLADANVAPSAACDVAAMSFRLGMPLQVDTGVTISMKALLMNRQGIVAGFPVYESYESCDAGGRVPMFKPGERVFGGDSVLIVGYDSYGWIARTAHGEDFGDKGYVVLPYGHESIWMEAWTAPIQP